MESSWSRASTMLPEEDWLARRKIYRQVSRYLKDHDNEETWFPILYTWEIQPCDVDSEFDHGHVVFANFELSKFLLINAYGQDPFDPCGKGHQHISFLNTLKTHANLVFCMMAYMGISGVKWVRATYTSDNAPSVSNRFLAEREVGPKTATPSYPPIVRINYDNYTACLTSLQLKGIDGLLRAAGMSICINAERSRAFAMRRGEESSLGFDLYGMDKDEREWKRAHYGRECAGCRQAFSTTELRKCGGCYMQQYCSVPCQKKQWPHHKAFCKSTQVKT